MTAIAKITGVSRTTLYSFMTHSRAQAEFLACISTLNCCQYPEQADEMGVTHVTVVILESGCIREKTWEGLFLVDTGAIDCLVPRPHLEAIRTQAFRQRAAGLVGWLMAVISKWTITGAGCNIEFMGEIVGGTIVFGETNAEPLLGVTALLNPWVKIDGRSA